MPGVGRAMTASGAAEMPVAGEAAAAGALGSGRRQGRGEGEWEGPGCRSLGKPAGGACGAERGYLVPGAASSEPGGATEPSD